MSLLKHKFEIINKINDFWRLVSRLDLLDKINADKDVKLVIISGRDRETFEKWFGDKDYTLIS